MQGDPIDYEDGMNRDVMFKSRKRELTFWIVMFLVLMSFFLFQYKNIIGGMMDDTDFNKVEGRIISSTSSFSSGGRTSSGYYVEIIYWYTVNGNKFESDKYSFGPSFYSDLGDVEAITKQYKPGDVVTVFVSKTNSNISVLTLQKNSNVKLIFVFCMLLLLFTAVYVDVRKRQILQDEKQGQKSVKNAITECEKCQKHNVTIIACIIDTVVIQKIMAHLDKKHPISIQASLLPPLRAPPNERYAKDFKIQRDFNFGA